MAQEQKNKGASRLTKDEEDALKQFLLHDMDRNGTVTAQEIIDFMEAMGAELSDEETKERRDWVKLIDTNEDGAVSVEEFIAMMERNKMVDSPLELFKFLTRMVAAFSIRRKSARP
ncbi:calmodulin-like isoform X2 [Branchiostoma floridae]|nr:calmodulin-like isoform X2 [Branchiostoma floridae]XP_035689197.1 calmodulin-like isoform X2 [Branchiostoma floridae]